MPREMYGVKPPSLRVHQKSYKSCLSIVLILSENTPCKLFCIFEINRLHFGNRFAILLCLVFEAIRIRTVNDRTGGIHASNGCRHRASNTVEPTAPHQQPHDSKR